MPELSLVVLYVGNLETSAAFYADLLGRKPAEASSKFAMFASRSDAGLGLWSSHAVEPAATAIDGGTEVVFAASDVDAVHTEWKARGLPIVRHQRIWISAARSWPSIRTAIAYGSSHLPRHKSGVDRGRLRHASMGRAGGSMQVCHGRAGPVLPPYPGKAGSQRLGLRRVEPVASVAAIGEDGNERARQGAWAACDPIRRTGQRCAAQPALQVALTGTIAPP